VAEKVKRDAKFEESIRRRVISDEEKENSETCSK